MSDFDLDIDHYELNDLLSIFSLDITSTADSIKETTQEYIDNANKRNQINIANFYIEAQKKILIALEEDITQNNTQNNTNVSTYYDYDKHSKVGPDYVTNKKVINSVDYIEGDKNPLFKNEYYSIVNIDSAFRQNNNTIDSAYDTSNFKSTLTFALGNVIEYSVYSFEIPYSWYAFSSNYGNTTMLINDIEITIPDGNYTVDILRTSLNTLLSNNSIDITLTLDTISNKITMENTSATDDYSIVLYSSNIIFTNSYSNVNLGYNLGFTANSTFTLSLGDSITASSTINIYGTKYLLLKINDYSLNRASSGIIGTMHHDNKCDYPSYLARDLPTTSTGDNSHSVNVDNTSFPKRLTQAKAYTINAILNTRSTNTTTTTSSLEKSTDIMIKIPIPNQNALLDSPNKLYAETGGYLSNYKREFFGKVNLFKIHTELLDDKGRTVDLNGQDWSYTLLVKHLYQY
tara:strand:+ start:883 stop:2262 length:1380 start_codon:yes stop_codon:yes gene_type:complete